MEKHFTLRCADGGVDATISLEPEEMEQLVTETERAWRSLGVVTYGPTEAEKPSMQFRRSLYIAQDIKAGEQLTSKTLRSVRPGMGLASQHYDHVLGKRVNVDLTAGTPLKWDYIG